MSVSASGLDELSVDIFIFCFSVFDRFTVSSQSLADFSSRGRRPAASSLSSAVGVSCDREVYFQGMKGKIDEYSDSDDDQHDAYLERMKAEGKIREEGNDSDESDSGSGESVWYRTRLSVQHTCRFKWPSCCFHISDESFNPGEEDDDIAEE